ncbi:MAG TPA: GGDEF domain-containing protein [Gemmataceae bacterium]|nr:GGDEF domain-containing protein [Gemmataceae bacterium]
MTPVRRPVTAANRNACLVHIYPTGSQMGQRYELSDVELIIGRGEDTDIRIADNSISRRHARLVPMSRGIVVKDLGSTNGTFVNDEPIQGSRVLQDGDYLRIGNCIYRFLAGGNVESEYHEEIYRLTIVDALTQVHNQRALLEFLERELGRSARHSRPLALLMIDIDLFKKVNDDLGHLAGDFALRGLATLVTRSVRQEDLFARYGGEEFALVLVETTLKEAMEVADRLRKTIGEHIFTFETKPFHITVSIGVASTTGDETLATQDMIRVADEKLYEAKHNGRNQVVG